MLGPRLRGAVLCVLGQVGHSLGKRFCQLWFRGDRLDGSGRLWGGLKASKIGIKGDADKGIEADSNPFAVSASVGIECRGKSDIKGHGSL